MKPLIVKIFIFLGIICAITGFYYSNITNYVISKKIQQNIIDHPENLPTKQVAENISLGFKNLKADMYRLRAVQYIGGNAIGSEYKKYLYNMLDIITELNPYFEHPYIIGELLLPSYSPKYESEFTSKEKQNDHVEEAILIGKKGVANFCDPVKLAAIRNEFTIDKLFTEDTYKDPCKSYQIAYHLGFIYYHYLKDPIESSYYYRIASAHTDSIEGARVMAAIMQGKGGDRQKSFFMFMDMAQNIAAEEESSCGTFASELGSLALSGQLRSDSQTIQAIEKMRLELFGEEMVNPDDPLKEADCLNFLGKAIRELNLSYIEAADQKFVEENKKHSYNAYQLKQEGYIDFLPTDPQKNADNDGFQIIYKFNEETQNYDYDLGKYK